MHIEHLVNDQIKCGTVTLVGIGSGGVMPVIKALEMAREQGLDLVLVSDKEEKHVCKIMDYNKMLYEEDKNVKRHKQPELKEIKMKCNIAEHDILVKVANAQRILREKDRVKVSVIYKGREMQNINGGNQIIKAFAEKLEGIAVMNNAIKREGNQVCVVLNPK